MKFLKLFLLSLLTIGFLLSCSDAPKETPVIDLACVKISQDIEKAYDMISPKLDSLTQPIYRQFFVIKPEYVNCYTENMLNSIGFQKSGIYFTVENGRNVEFIYYTNCEKHSVITLMKSGNKLGIIYDVVHVSKWKKIKKMDKVPLPVQKCN